MTWTYRIAKETIADKVRYRLVEAYLNDEGGIWGYTPHVDILQHIQYDDYDDDEQLREDIASVLNMVLGDSMQPMIDIDTFVATSSGFEEELEVIKSGN